MGKIETIAKIDMLNAGIIPAFSGRELIDMLSSLSLEEKRKATRKFRKQWKKILKDDPSLNENNFFLPEDGQYVEKSHIRNRSVMVVQKFLTNAGKHS